MNTLKLSTLAKGAVLSLFSAVAAFAASSRDWSEWMSHYYEAPQPDQVVSAAFGLSRSGYFDSAEHRTTAIGFFAGVFSQNPERVQHWVSAFRDLPTADERLMASALWYAGSPAGAERLRALARRSNPEMRAEIEQLVAQQPPSLRNTPVQSEGSLNLQWGAFLATGDSQYVVNVLAALGSREPGLSNQARFALARNATAHRKVYEICQTQLARQPDAVREQIHAVLTEAHPRM